jgi:alanine racemase
MRAVIEISKENLIHNIQSIKKNLHPDTQIMSVVKQNAYGHGLQVVAETIDKYTDYFAVYHFEEAIELQVFTQKPILILGGVNSYPEAVVGIQSNFHCSVYCFEQLMHIEKASRDIKQKAKIHFSVNTGLNREGFLYKEFKRAFTYAINKCEFFEIDGMYSHFANIEDTSDRSYSDIQIENFGKFVDYTRPYKYYLENFKTYLSSTAGIMVYEKKFGHSKIVRPGIGLYGMYPSKQLELEYKSQGFELKPVLKLKTQIRNIFVINPGDPVSYGCTWVATTETRVATIPVGYGDGLLRKVSNIGKVLIHGQYCPILGRQAMDIMVVDITHLKNQEIGDEVVIIGSQGDKNISPEYIADLCGTINYEITTQLDRSLSRRLI